MRHVYMRIMRVCYSPEVNGFSLTATVELAPLRAARHRMGKSYVEAYFQYFPAAYPKEDQDDRNALYCLQVAHSRMSTKGGESSLTYV